MIVIVRGLAAKLLSESSFPIVLLSQLSIGGSLV